jgi:NADH-quinone oxidoreductase subunit E
MSVRRLAPAEVQPKEFAFTAENLDWAKKQLLKFPEGRQASAVIPLMWRAQEQHHGWLPEAAIRYVADMIGMEYIRALEVATFYTMFLLQPVGKKAHIQVCGTTPCRLRGADALFEVCHKRIAHEPFELSADGNFSWEEVECLGACVNAPMALIWKDTYEDLTAESFEKLLDGFAAGKPPKPGPQIDRQLSAPVGGPTTLTDKSIYAAPSKASGAATQTALLDREAKKPTKAAGERESPAPAPRSDKPKSK